MAKLKCYNFDSCELSPIWFCLSRFTFFFLLSFDFWLECSWTTKLIGYLQMEITFHRKFIDCCCVFFLNFIRFIRQPELHLFSHSNINIKWKFIKYKNHENILHFYLRSNDPLIAIYIFVWLKYCSFVHSFIFVIVATACNFIYLTIYICMSWFISFAFSRSLPFIDDWLLI